MPFTQSEKIALIERFAPILFLHEEEPAFPVSPIGYVEASALWSSTPPGHPKMGWGLPRRGARRPLIPHKGISLDPAHDTAGTADPDGDGVPEHYLGHSGRGTFPFLNPRGLELWLDFAGWHDGHEVTASSANQRTTLEARPLLRQPCYTAEVWTIEEWRDQIGPQETLLRFGLAPQQHPPQLANLAVISYYLLFPLHRQPRPITARDPEDDPNTGNYEGDWTCFAVVVRVSGHEQPSLSVEPVFGAFGRRWRGASRDFEEHSLNRMGLRPWNTLETVDDHAVVQASHGTHNLYPHDPPQTESGSIRPQEGIGDSLSGVGNSFVQDLVEQPGSAGMALVTAAKIAAGFAIAGIFGAIVGAIAAGAEAALAAEEGIVDVPELEMEGGGGSEGDIDAEEIDSEESGLSTQSRVATPTGTVPPFADPDDADIQPWSCTAAEALGEVAAPLLFPAVPDHPRFEGRWGVRCVEDPQARRIGIKFPRYRQQVVDALLTQG